MSGTPHRKRWQRVPFNGAHGTVSYEAKIEGRLYQIFPHGDFWWLVCEGVDLTRHATVLKAMRAARLHDPDMKPEYDFSGGTRGCIRGEKP